MDGTTWHQLAALRLRRQHLEERPPREQLLDVVRDHVAIQARVMSSAELALNARVDGLRPDDVRDALWQHRTIVKNWVLLVGGRVEGTWTHEVRRGRLQVDLRPWRALSAIERRAIDVEADRIAAFLGAPPTVEVAAPA